MDERIGKRGAARRLRERAKEAERVAGGRQGRGEGEGRRETDGEEGGGERGRTTAEYAAGLTGATEAQQQLSVERRPDRVEMRSSERSTSYLEGHSLAQDKLQLFRVNQPGQSQTAVGQKAAATKASRPAGAPGDEAAVIISAPRGRPWRGTGKKEKETSRGFAACRIAGRRTLQDGQGECVGARAAARADEDEAQDQSRSKPAGGRRTTGRRLQGGTAGIAGADSTQRRKDAQSTVVLCRVCFKGRVRMVVTMRRRQATDQTSNTANCQRLLMCAGRRAGFLMACSCAGAQGESIHLLPAAHEWLDSREISTRPASQPPWRLRGKQHRDPPRPAGGLRTTLSSKNRQTGR